MIGVFDSGVGGLTALSELRRLLPDADICFFADRKNAPYGTKSRKDIVEIVKKNVKLLASCGAEKILMACCTASTVYPYLSNEEKEISVPIIRPTARMAVEISRSARIGVIATKRTVQSKAFSNEIKALSKDAFVIEKETQFLVSLIESGARDFSLKNDDRALIKNAILPLTDYGIDTLILGCTHFPHVRREIEKITGLKTVSSSEMGAREIASLVRGNGSGRTVLL